MQNIRKLSAFAGLLLALTGTAQAQSKATLAEVFNGEMLNSNLRYFESVAGVARAIRGDQHTYKVDGCRVEVEAPGGTIGSLSLDIDEQCKIGLESFLGESFAPDMSRPLTFGNFATHTGQFHFYADCLTGCGNSHDPSVYAHWEGPRAVGFINVSLEVALVAPPAIAAANQWEAVMEKSRGADYVIETAFNCEPTFDETAARIFRDVRVTRITIGPIVGGPQCG